jgi:hypothetical protein
MKFVVVLFTKINAVFSLRHRISLGSYMGCLMEFYESLTKKITKETTNYPGHCNCQVLKICDN